MTAKIGCTIDQRGFELYGEASTLMIVSDSAHARELVDLAFDMAKHQLHRRVEAARTRIKERRLRPV